MLCHPIQRYKFESNSQLTSLSWQEIVSCVIRYKDTNLKAIHNKFKEGIKCRVAVSSDTKIQIWKQFTTVAITFSTSVPLCHPIQRYKFESNSQPQKSSYYKSSKLCHPIQRYKFESNSQQRRLSPSNSMSCVIRYKDTNLKAIHNCHQEQPLRVHAVSSDTKIQIWKQFTTGRMSNMSRSTLCHPIQRYKFESNSQRRLANYTPLTSCVIRYKDTNLKAIHN